MFDDYDEACDAVLTAPQAKREVEEHGLSWYEFRQDVGFLPSYTGKQVLDWLGYCTLDTPKRGRYRGGSNVRRGSNHGSRRSNAGKRNGNGPRSGGG